jgi:hypothetical protein
MIRRIKMSNLTNTQIMESIIEDVEKMSLGAMAHEIGQPWRCVGIRRDAVDSLIEDVCNKRFEAMGD